MAAFCSYNTQDSEVTRNVENIFISPDEISSKRNTVLLLILSAGPSNGQDRFPSFTVLLLMTAYHNFH